MRLRRARAKRNGAWAGNGALDSAISPTNTVVGQLVWDPQDSERMNLAGIGTTRRTLLDFTARHQGPVGSADILIYWYLMVFQTDLTEAAPSAIVFDPAAANDPDFYEKRVLASGHQRLCPPSPGGVTTGQSPLNAINASYDIGAKHRITNVDSLLFVYNAFTTGVATTLNFSWRCRTYVSW